MYVGNDSFVLDGESAQSVNELANSLISFNTPSATVEGKMMFTGSSLSVILRLKNVKLSIKAKGNRDKVDDLVREICQVVQENKLKPIPKDKFGSRNSNFSGSISKGSFDIHVDLL